MNMNRIFALCFFVMIAGGIAAGPLLCRADDDESINDSENVTVKDLNKGYNSGFMNNSTGGSEIYKRFEDDNLGVDKKDLIDTESNTKTDDQMSDQDKYTE